MASVLFVCLGNICRSPTGEGILKAIVEREGATRDFRIDSCGTGGGAGGWYKAGGWSFHTGERADARMSKEASKRGYALTSCARTLTKTDIEEFDYIICMEDKNRDAVLEAADENAGILPDTEHPWYEGGFDHVLDLLEDACEGLYSDIVRTNQLST